jgi:hypothetical protein
MGFLCKTKKNKYLDNPIDRDLGLSNINNINSTTNFCFEPFNGPTYNLSGATKPLTGNTSPCSGTPTNCYAVYNLSEIDDFDLKFNFTGSTDYTGYTGDFCYNIYNRKKFTLSQPNTTLRGVTPVYSKCINFSAITSSTITNTILKSDLFFIDTDYMLKGYYKFKPKKCGNGQIIDTWETSSQANNFNFDFDWYFITIKNPTVPQILPIGTQQIIDQTTLVQEVIPGSAYQNNFSLGSQPIGNKINLYVNGIRLTEREDFRLNVEAFPSINPIVEILTGNIEPTDVIAIVYLVGPQSFLTANGSSRNDLFEIDTFSVTGITTNVTASTVNIVNSNTAKGTQEVFLTKDFDTKNTMVGALNGITLREGIEYYRSTSTRNKIIINPNFTTIKVGDILSFWYFTTILTEKENLGTLDKDSLTIGWTVNPITGQYVTGEFVLEVTEKSDTNWSSLFYTTTIDYLPDSGVYSQEVTNLEVNKDYKFRIIFNKTYKNILNEPIISSTEKIGSFNTRNDKIIYGY